MPLISHGVGGLPNSPAALSARGPANQWSLSRRWGSGMGDEHGTSFPFDECRRNPLRLKNTSWPSWD